MYYQAENPFVDKYKQMERIMTVVLPEYIRSTGKTLVAAEVIKEFADMEQVRGTIVEAATQDVVTATMSYLNHHFFGTAKPDWYKHLTE